MESLDWLILFKAHIYLRHAAALLFAIWLFFLWRRQRSSVYVWLLVGLGLAPFLQHLLPYLYSFTKPLFPPQGVELGYIRLFFWFMLECLRIGCLVMALSQIASGRVR